MKIYIFLFVYCFSLLVNLSSDSPMKPILEKFGIEQKLLLIDFVEGDFIDNKQKKVIAFYKSQETDIQNENVEIAFCITLDEHTMKLLSSYVLPEYETGQFNKNSSARNIDSMNFPDLGKKFQYGWVGDFNKNGKEEIYLFHFIRGGFIPIAYEFYQTGFKVILDFSSYMEIKDSTSIGSPVIGNYLKITNVNKAEKSITFDKLLENGTEQFTFIWNANMNSYLLK